MPTETLIMPAQTEEILNLVELHRQLIQRGGFTAPQEHDSYSLAQPSPYRFVPTVASNGAATVILGE